MLYFLLAAGLLGLIFIPSFRVRQVMAKHAVDRPDLPGTGRGLARHLLDEAGLEHVKVEEAKDGGDHYDPMAKAVRLSKANYIGRSLTAVAVATHEVSHALQDRDGYAPLKLRTRLAKKVQNIERFGSIVLLATPVIGVITRAPWLVAAEIGTGLLIMSSTIVIHALTLPAEFNASFARALPILRDGGYLDKKDIPAVREVLKAAAYTYVAGAFSSLLSITRWLRVLR